MQNNNIYIFNYTHLHAYPRFKCHNCSAKLIVFEIVFMLIDYVLF